MTRVLLVEDSAEVLYILQLELESMGYEVTATVDARVALEVAGRLRPDVIVSDIGMPSMDGLEFIRCIREIPKLASVPAIALTGAGLNNDVQKALAFGFTLHLTKPVEAAELANRIKVLTAKRLWRKAG